MVEKYSFNMNFSMAKCYFSKIFGWSIWTGDKSRLTGIPKNKS